MPPKPQQSFDVVDSKGQMGKLRTGFWCQFSHWGFATEERIQTQVQMMKTDPLPKVSHFATL
jgi:hypothetical protein